jgi:hypothetical protein
LKEAKESLIKLEEEAPLKDKEVREREKEAAKRKAELEDIRKGREEVDRETEVAEAASRFIECRKEFQRLEEQISRIKEAEKAVADYRQRVNAHVAPDGKMLKAIRKAMKERDEAQLRIEASLITLEIVPWKEDFVEVVAGETIGPVAMKAGVPVHIKGSPEVVVDLPGVARLRTWGPVDSVEEHRDSRAKAEKRLKELTEIFGTFDLDELEQMAEKAKELAANLAEAETKLKTLLGGHIVDELFQERSLLETTLKRPPGQRNLRLRHRIRNRILSLLSKAPRERGKRRRML